MLPLFFLFAALVIPDHSLQKAFSTYPGAFVLVDCSTGKTICSNEIACREEVAPCSTFKIWNSAIGLETGVVKDPDALFWKWDGQKRGMESWNQDQTLRSAIAVSCVPAYQNLARKIGQERMQTWLDKIGYGDRNISAGIDLFWLPKPGRKTLLITPIEQAQMVAKLVNGQLPFSDKTLVVLRSILTLKTTDHGTLFGKTGSGTDANDHYILGWFVGFVESSGKRYAFACLLKGNGAMGKDARTSTESILSDLKLL